MKRARVRITGKVALILVMGALLVAAFPIFAGGAGEQPTVSPAAGGKLSGKISIAMTAKEDPGDTYTYGMYQLIKNWNQLQPGVQIEWIVVPGADHRKWITAQFQAEQLEIPQPPTRGR